MKDSTTNSVITGDRSTKWCPACAEEDGHDPECVDEMREYAELVYDHYPDKITRPVANRMIELEDLMNISTLAHEWCAKYGRIIDVLKRTIDENK